MTRRNISSAYFDWLYKQCFRVRDIDSAESYSVVLTHMHSIPFNDRVPNDDNRNSEGEELRDEFISTLRKVEVQDFAEIYNRGKASLLEMLVALSRRCDYISSIGADVWFRKFMENLGLLNYSDGNWRPQLDRKIAMILNRFNDRAYDASGNGGIFPLRQWSVDQRRAELWVQMSAYMTEQHLY